MSKYRDGGRNSFYEHDDRTSERVVKYGGYNKSGGNGNRRRGRDNNKRWGNVDGRVRMDEEGDVQMEGESSRKSRAYTPYEPRWGKGKGGRQRGGQRRWENQRNNNNPPPNNFQNKQHNKTHWFKIMLPNTADVDKTYLLKSITQFAQEIFTPINFHRESHNSIFYVEGSDVRKAIHKCNMKIDLPNGNKMRIIIFQTKEPNDLPFDAPICEIMKTVMAKRYNVALSALDLSSFDKDPDLKDIGFFVSLGRFRVLANVLKIIEDNIPELKALDLSNNRMNFDQMKVVAVRIKSLKALVLSGNNIRNFIELDGLRGLQLEELSLVNTPLYTNNNHTKEQGLSYVRAIRQRFPKLVRLDGQALQPMYGFGVEAETVLPQSQGNFFVNDHARGFVPRFLELYFSIYDSDDRQRLIEAYHDQATFSLSAVSNLGRGGLKTDNNIFQQYISESRNLHKINNPIRRQKLLRQGKINVVSFLCQLPKTQHDAMSFSIDVSHDSGNLVTFSCSGIFKEGDRPGLPIRAFSRVFILIPQGDGYVITNEMLFVTNATQDQVKVAFKVPAPTPSPSPVPPAIAAVPTVTLSSEQQQQMVIAFSQQSGMNADWSMKCLQENDWDFNKSLCIFREFHSIGKIPAEAFVLI